MTALVVSRPSRLAAPAPDTIGGLDPFELAERFGTPVYVYDLAVIDQAVEALRAALPERVEVAYAVKANPSLALLSQLRAAGLGADVASAGELAAVLGVGFDPGRIVMTGPGKRDDELLVAVHAGVRAITVESPRELRRLEAIAADLAVRQPVLLRASSSEDRWIEGRRLIGDGGIGKFGMSEADLVAAAHHASGSPHLVLAGLHAFGASNVLDADALIDHAATTVELAGRIAAATGVALRLVDVGGGLGIPYRDDEAPLDLDRLGEGLAAIAARMAADPHLADARLLVEPGRFVVGRSGTFLTRVVDRKTAGDDEVVIVDGGIHQLLRPVLVGQPHRFRVHRQARWLGDRARPSTGRSVAIAGPLCSGLDIFCQAVLDPPEVGDLIAILDTGAYGFTESMPLFLSHPIPAEVAVSDGHAACIRPRLEPAAWLDAQRLPDWPAGV